MVEFINVTKVYQNSGQCRVILDGQSFKFPEYGCIGIIGGNGVGKTTVLNLINGNVLPSSGKIVLDTTVSWPIGYMGILHKKLSGLENIHFLSRMYNYDYASLKSFIRNFTGLEEELRQPVYTYSSGMKSKLSFAMSISMPFGTYLLDEVTAVGDEQFKNRCHEHLIELSRRSRVLLVSHSRKQIIKLCESVIVLRQGKFKYFDDVREGWNYHTTLLRD